MVHAEAPRNWPRPSASAAPTRLEPSADRLELNGKYSEIKRSGRWEVPSQIAIANKYGETKLDFTEAYIPHEVVQIIAGSKWGSIQLIVPPEASVSTDGISEFKWGSVNDKRKSAPLRGTPHFAVYGSLHGGSLVIRNSRWM
jgi:hypothetical protein